MTMPSLSAVRGTSSSVSARGAALDLIGAVLRQKHPLDEAIDDHPAMSELPARDRAFARLLVATVLRRLGQEGASLIANQDEARLNVPAWLWRNWGEAYGEATTRAIAMAHLHEAPLDISVRSNPERWRERLDAVML